MPLIALITLSFHLFCILISYRNFQYEQKDNKNINKITSKNISALLTHYLPVLNI